jgi:serine/threonine protein kinase
MRVAPGTRFGPYEVIGSLGAGGMGEVYEARDTRLDRSVAIKVLPAELAHDAAARARFDREARAIAALNHPNICALHDIGDADGHGFLVMERLDGETLQDRLQRGPLDVEQTLDYGIALADALDAAHGRGLIHRDLKPANVFITTRGVVKILDFGLAKTVQDTDADVTRIDPTLTTVGTTVGTVAYMSPEQLRGEPLDVRTDLFSCGLVLYEMATGQRAFAGSTIPVLSAAILTEQPPAPSAVRRDLPSMIDGAIVRALEKDRASRYQSAAELRTVLSRIKREGFAAVIPVTTPIPGATAATPSAKLSWSRSLAFVLSCTVVFVAAFTWWSREPLEPPRASPGMAAPPSEVPPPAQRSTEPAAGGPEPPVTPPQRGQVPGPPDRAEPAPPPDLQPPTSVTSPDPLAGSAPVTGRGMRQRPRRGFGAGGDTLAKLLRNAPPETYDLVYASNDPEAMSMALQIRGILSSAGWTNASTVEIAQPQAKLGIFAPRPTPAITALGSWAVRSGLEPDIRRVATLPRPRIVIGRQQP